MASALKKLAVWRLLFILAAFCCSSCTLDPYGVKRTPVGNCQHMGFVKPEAQDIVAQEKGYDFVSQRDQSMRDEVPDLVVKRRGLKRPNIRGRSVLIDDDDYDDGREVEDEDSVSGPYGVVRSEDLMQSDRKRRSSKRFGKARPVILAQQDDEDEDEDEDEDRKGSDDDEYMHTHAHSYVHKHKRSKKHPSTHARRYYEDSDYDQGVSTDGDDDFVPLSKTPKKRYAIEQQKQMMRDKQQQQQELADRARGVTVPEKKHSTLDVPSSPGEVTKEDSKKLNAKLQALHEIVEDSTPTAGKSKVIQKKNGKSLNEMNGAPTQNAGQSMDEDGIQGEVSSVRNLPKGKGDQRYTLKSKPIPLPQ